MAADQKKKLLTTLRILLEETDEEHPLDSGALLRMLSDNGVEAERKSLYADLSALREAGYDIQKRGGLKRGFFIGSRDFQLPELKLLVDAVQSSKFVTEKKSHQLIRRLEKLTSRWHAQELNRQVYIYNRIKTENESIFYSIDQIHDAISHNRKLRFQYMEWSVEKKLCPKRNGEPYQVSPWAVTWDNENYYLIAFEDTAREIRFYRVDKMKRVEQLEEERDGRQLFENFDLADFARKTFGMFHGTDREVRLRGSNSIAGVLLDRFGTDVIMLPDGPDCFTARFLVSVSPQFFGWLTGIGSAIQLTGPEEVVQEYRKYLQEILRRL